MRVAQIAIYGAIFTLSAAGSRLQAQPAEPPVVTISGPTVIAFWRAPESDSQLAADPQLASALDQQQTYWADSYGRLADLGIAALAQAGRRFLVKDGLTDRIFQASPDSSDIGYVLVSPGRELRVLYRLHFPDELVPAAREYFGMEQRLFLRGDPANAAPHHIVKQAPSRPARVRGDGPTH